MEKDILLQEFGVKNHAELMEYMDKHPEDERVQQLLEIFEELEKGVVDEEE